MIRKPITHLGAVTLLLGAGVLHANLYQPSADAVQHQARVLERAVTASSVTSLYTPEQRAAKLAMIESARRDIEAGNYKTALARLDEAGRQLYPMADYRGIPLEGDKRLQWLLQVESTFETILPVARQIADEKDRPLAALDAAEARFRIGQMALAEGLLEEAEPLMSQAYNRLQAEVVALRSGDDLRIEPPSAGTEAAWEDAARRYADWRYFADWMEQAYAELGIDPNLVSAGSAEADRIYQQARDRAADGHWQEATVRIDRAYRVMEEHWRRAGIDI